MKRNYFIMVIVFFLPFNSCSREQIANEGGNIVGSIIGYGVIIFGIIRILTTISKPKK